VRWLGAILPLAMTFTVIAVGVIRAVQIGGFREPDENAAAHLFQLFMPAEVPIVALFAATQWPRDPAWTARVVALQVGTAAALFAGVFFLT
jgi:hypothetical protein